MFMNPHLRCSILFSSCKFFFNSDIKNNEPLKILIKSVRELNKIESANLVKSIKSFFRAVTYLISLTISNSTTAFPSIGIVFITGCINIGWRMSETYEGATEIVASPFTGRP